MLGSFTPKRKLRTVKIGGCAMLADSQSGRPSTSGMKLSLKSAPALNTLFTGLMKSPNATIPTVSAMTAKLPTPPFQRRRWRLTTVAAIMSPIFCLRSDNNIHGSPKSKSIGESKTRINAPAKVICPPSSCVMVYPSNQSPGVLSKMN